MGYPSSLPPSRDCLPLVFAALLLLPAAAWAQAVPRTDTPCGGTLRLTFEPVITTWGYEFTPQGRTPIGATLPGTAFIHQEQRVTPLLLEWGITNRLAIGAKAPLVRVHSRCLTGDVFHSARCDCGPQLDAAMEKIALEGRGVLLYLNQEGRGIGLANKIRAYELQEQGLDTVEANERLGFKADQRDYGIGVQILRDLGVRSMRLLSNNPRKLVGIEGYHLSVVDWIPLEIPPSEHTRRYLKAKKEKLGHKLTSV